MILKLLNNPLVIALASTIISGTTVFLLVPKTPKPAPSIFTSLEEIKLLGFLQTVQQTTRSEVTVEFQESGIFGIRFLNNHSLTYIAFCKINAGIDFQKLRPETAQLDSNIIITLPPPEILSGTTELDLKNSHAVDIKDEVFSSHSGARSVLLLVQDSAKKMCEGAAIQGNILSQAERQAAKVLYSFLKGKTYYKVVIRSSSGDTLAQENNIRPNAN